MKTRFRLSTHAATTAACALALVSAAPASATPLLGSFAPPFSRLAGPAAPFLSTTMMLPMNARLGSRDLFRRSVSALLTHPGLGLRNVDATLPAGAPPDSMQVMHFDLFGVPLCGGEVRGHTLRTGEMVVLGHIPQLDPNATAPTAWPDGNALLGVDERIREEVEKDGVAATSVQITATERCAMVRGGAAVAAVRIAAKVKRAGDLDTDPGLPYLAFLDEDGTLTVAQSFLEATGTANVYKYNSVRTTSRTSEPLINLADDGTLKSDLIQTVLPSGYTQAVEPTHVYNFPESDARFAEASAFAHVQEHELFFESIGYTWVGTKPLQINLHKAPNGDTNNALYTPWDATTPPAITVGEGDGVQLANLGTDGDVVSHEFGHHVVFQALTNTTGEDLPIHEGLADFFVFMRTGDACIGETICPSTSTVCIIPSQCLRSGEFDVKYNDANWQKWFNAKGKLGHLHGQAISGAMWALYKNNTFTLTDLAKLVYRAVTLLPATCGFKNLFAAILIADHELNADAHSTAIRASLTARGFASFLPAEGTLPTIDSKASATTTPTVDPSAPKADSTSGTSADSPAKKKKKDTLAHKLGCSALAAPAADQSGALLALALGLILAAASAIRRRPQRQKQKAAKR